MTAEAMFESVKDNLVNMFGVACWLHCCQKSSLDDMEWGLRVFQCISCNLAFTHV